MIGWENVQGAFFINDIKKDVSNLVDENAELSEEIGDVSSLSTSDKSNIVSAVNEIYSVANGKLTRHDTPLASSDDIDDLRNPSDAGFYAVGASVNNAPAEYCMLVVITSYVNGYAVQACFTDSQIFLRKYSGSWTTWKSLTAT